MKLGNSIIYQNLILIAKRNLKKLQSNKVIEIVLIYLLFSNKFYLLTC